MCEPYISPSFLYVSRHSGWNVEDSPSAYAASPMMGPSHNLQTSSFLWAACCSNRRLWPSSMLNFTHFGALDACFTENSLALRCNLSPESSIFNCTIPSTSEPNVSAGVAKGLDAVIGIRADTLFIVKRSYIFAANFCTSSFVNLASRSVRESMTALLHGKLSISFLFAALG